MLEEVKRDVNNDRLYMSARLNDNGKKIYKKLLEKAITNGDERTLAKDLLDSDCFNKFEQRKIKGVNTQAKVPYNANEVLAAGEFNRFYIRALCLISLENHETLEIYRAKKVSHARSVSESMIGKEIDATKTLEDLRKNIGIDASLNLPPGPNSGLSVRFKS